MRRELLPNYRDLLYEALTHLADHDGLRHRELAALLGITDPTNKVGDETNAVFRRLIFRNGRDGAVRENEAKRHERSLIAHWEYRISSQDSLSLNEIYSTIRNRIIKRVTTKKDFLVLTSVNWDTILQVDALGENETDFDAYASSVSNHPGGAGVNTASILSDLGMRCGVVGCVANDVQSKRVVDRLIARGLDVEFVYNIDNQIELTCGSTSILSLKGKRVRHIYRARGANHYFSSAHARPSDSLKSALSECPCIIISNLDVNSYKTISELLNYVPADAVVVIRIDAGTARMRLEDCAPLFARANIVYSYDNLLRKFLNETFLDKATSTDTLLSKYFSLRSKLVGAALQPQIVLAKNDSQSISEGGAEYIAGGQWLANEYPTYIATKLITSEKIVFTDSTGEADAFIAGLLLCASHKNGDLADSESEWDNWENSLLLATSASLYCGTQLGGSPNISSIEELIRFRDLAYGL